MSVLIQMRHPVYTFVGALYAIALVGMTSLMWFGILGRVMAGQPVPGNQRLALAVVSILAWWYVNYMTVYHRLKRLDPATYAWATKDMGFIAYIFSRRSGPAHLHNVLTTLDLDRYPASFRLHVRGTVLANAILLWTIIALAAAFFITRCGAR